MTTAGVIVVPIGVGALLGVAASRWRGRRWRGVLSALLLGATPVVVVTALVLRFPVVGFWDAVADAAPAMGMAGTILGLVSMFASMDDPATIGPAMAIALLATFHGMVIANMIAGPIARRLERLSALEIAWQHELADRLVAIGRRETAPPIASPAHSRKSALREVA